MNPLRLLLPALAAWMILAAGAEAGLVRGVVFHDRNANGRRDAGEEGIPAVAVSDGSRVVVTDEAGAWEMPYEGDAVYFVIKPRDWTPPTCELNLPLFHYAHRPEGSPVFEVEGLHRVHPGIEPTGPLPESIDFALLPSPEPERFKALVLADTQVRNEQEIRYLGFDMIPELARQEAAFGVTLGDITFDNFSVLDRLSETMALIGVPWYHAPGNHDKNLQAPPDEPGRRWSNETYIDHFGPPWYAFNYGPVHFIVMDTVIWRGWQGRPVYGGGLSDEQLEFIENSLALVDPDRLVVLMMHIPYTDWGRRSPWRERLFDLIQDRPHTLSIAAHKHRMFSVFHGLEEGWGGRRPHHLAVAPTASGNLYGGAPDEYGIPHAMMSCGAPKGYLVATFDGHHYDLRFKASRRPADHQMSIWSPPVMSAGDGATTASEVVVNFYIGAPGDQVRMRLGEDGDWLPMDRTVRLDPYFDRIKQLERSPRRPPGRGLIPAVPSEHIWTGRLPVDTPPGTHLLHVRARDMFGRTHEDRHVIRVEQ